LVSNNLGKITVGSCCEHVDEQLDSTTEGNYWTNEAIIFI